MSQTGSNRSRQRAQSQAAFVAELADKVIGWIEVSIQHRLQSAPYALIGGLVVKEGFRNRKVGLRLCEQAEAWSWEHGVSVIRVTSRSTRLDAHRFYENNGYRLTKVSQIFEKKPADVDSADPSSRNHRIRPKK